ncbi:EamA-like transporter family protein [Variibacter gotjawalensis]|uniref:EamA-like transporter family protein n=1 Tax=Variibacter gotjawalensis TaxID=1333996 RepID=A0A0S3PPP4_9BRAD|nr:DMT family transporter [Variibacter gotjawalensis]NIK48184.1 drug/metabolite transporter (DMT)-like permease [Variibacter gotjawalensis]RZS50056.1 EamA-like transporter family protein [Variibacter gotjawalensis]BAT57887.1 EamA-like transporter family protein [Variibacter gotjawalensis]
MTEGWLWALFTVIAAAAQTARNAMQRELTATLGTAGATHVRFLFGFPFALIAVAAIAIVSGQKLPVPNAAFWPWVILGAASQILATGLMLAAMGERSFVVTIAYTKTEPIQVALFGLIFLGEHITPLLAAAILIATAGVMVMSFKPGASGTRDWKPAALGLASGAMFAFSAIGFRGAIRALDGQFFMVSSFTLAVGLALQAGALTLYLMWRERAILTAILQSWRPSMFAGFMGALASTFWFLAFALATAAAVRTLALVEVLFAQGVSLFVFGQKASARDVMGISLIVIGVVLLLWAT